MQWGSGTVKHQRRAQNRGGRHSQSERQSTREGMQEGEEERQSKEQKGKVKNMDGEGHRVPGRDGAMQGAGVGLVSCTLGLPGLSLGIAPTMGLPLSVAWEKQVPEWVRRDRGGQRAPTGNPGPGREGSRGGGRGEGTSRPCQATSQLASVAPVAPVAPLCHLYEWALPSSRLKLHPTPTASPGDPGKHISSFCHSPREREGVSTVPRNPSTMPSVAAPPWGPIGHNSR